MIEKNLKLLVVDDDQLVTDSISMILPSQWQLFKCHDHLNIQHRNYHAAFVDMHLSRDLNKTEGLDVIKKLSSRHPHLDIVAISGDLDRNLMEKCLRAGASRFLAKPLSNEEVILTLEKIEALYLLKDASARQGQQQQWIGSGIKSQELKKRIATLKSEKGPILIEGESGTGKEIVAQMLHLQEGGPFITVNVAAIPENLFESEFFGHVKGSFTGAEQNKMGLAEAAHGGDLFLDEIEALPLALQVKLLRFLECGEIRRVGGKETVQAEVRVLIATNKNLQQMVRNGEFREDLLWRISGKKIDLAPLRERKEDILELAEHFLFQDRPKRNKKIDSDALKAMQDYDWPGNVRELKRICEQLSLNSPLPVIRAEDVLKYLHLAQTGTLSSTIDFEKGLSRLVEEYEAYTILKCLEINHDIDQAAQRLQISRSSLYKKIKDYNIEYKA